MAITQSAFATSNVRRTVKENTANSYFLTPSTSASFVYTPTKPLAISNRLVAAVAASTSGAHLPFNEDVYDISIHVAIENGVWVASSKDGKKISGNSFEEVVKRMQYDLLCSFAQDTIDSQGTIFPSTFSFNITTTSSVESMSFLKLSESAFSFWDNEEDSIYDNL